MQLGIKEFDSGISVAAPAVTGLCAATCVLTLRGEVAVANLLPGDKVITRDTGMTTLRDVTCQRETFAPIRIKAGSLGHARPDRDMLTPPGAQLHVRDWRAQALYGRAAAAIPAERLVDGKFIAPQPQTEMDVYSLRFDHPHVIYADGVEIFIGG